MYKITIINNNEETIIHYPGSSKVLPHLLKAELDLKTNQISNLSFNIPYGNQGYSLIKDRITLIKAVNLKTNETFEGRIYTSTDNVESSGEVYKEVIAEDEISYLQDTSVRAWTITNMSIKDFLQKVVDNHNANTSSDKLFTLGNIEISGTITTATDFEQSLDCILKNTIDLFKGYLYVRKDGGIRYLDYLKQLPGKNDDIILGRNLKSMSFLKDATSIATRIVPVGKNNLSIASVNGGIDYIDNINAQNSLDGVIIEAPMKFEDIDNPTALKQAAIEKMDSTAQADYKLDTDILDLSTINVDPNGQHIGIPTNIVCNLINVTESFDIIEKVTDMLAPQNTKITFNDLKISARQMQIDAQNQAIQAHSTAKAAIAVAGQAESTANTADTNASNAVTAVNELKTEVSGSTDSSLTNRVATLEADKTTLQDGIKSNQDSITLNYNKFVALMDKLVSKNVITQTEEDTIKSMVLSS